MIFVVQIRSYPALTVNIEVYVKVWNRPICICINGIDVIKKKYLQLLSEDIIYIEEPDWLLFFFLRSPCMKSVS